jgi:hypothetical protein
VRERVLRPLNALKDANQQRKAWKHACKKSGKKPGKEIPTSSAIEEAIAGFDEQRNKKCT